MKCLMMAVIQSGGKQHLVREGQILKTEKLELEVGATPSFEVLLVTDDEGKNVKVGKPHVAGASVQTTVVKHGLGDKVLVVKYKPKVRYRRHVGHRQPFTALKIETITA